MSQRHWSPSPQQSGPQQFSRPKPRRGAAIAIIAAAILIATALIGHPDHPHNPTTITDKPSFSDPNTTQPGHEHHP